MSGIHVVYLVLALIFAIFITYMFVYNIRQNHRQQALRSKGRPLGTQSRHRRCSHGQGALPQHGNLLSAFHLPANEIDSKKGLHTLHRLKA